MSCLRHGASDGSRGLGFSADARCRRVGQTWICTGKACAADPERARLPTGSSDAPSLGRCRAHVESWIARVAAAPHRRNVLGTSADVDRCRGRGWKQGERRPSVRRSTPRAGGSVHHVRRRPGRDGSAFILDQSRLRRGGAADQPGGLASSTTCRGKEPSRPALTSRRSGLRCSRRPPRSPRRSCARRWWPSAGCCRACPRGTASARR